MSEVDGLDVYLHGDIAGLLERRAQARLHFTYSEDWVAGGRPALSLSLPVRTQAFDHDECAPFFEGLLPEGDFLKAIARTLHVSAANPFELLSDLGGECAGAISVAPHGGPPPGRDPRPPRWLNQEELGDLLADLPQRPLIAAIDEVEDGGFRLSLAGAQDKVGVLVAGEEVGLSHGKPPTTAILKAPIPHVSESVVNEAFCMSLAAHIDLEVAAAHPRVADSKEYLLVHRYDRSDWAIDGRIHQEDFCQALGLVPAVKYEREGGPTVADCAVLIRRHCSAPARDITAFLDALLFNFVIANHDGHSKNYSLLLDGPGAIRLAPLYDLISTAAFQGTDRKLAMRYGGENRPAYLRGRHLDRLASDLGVKPALVRRRAIAMRERTEAALEEVRRSLPEEFQDWPMVDKVTAIIRERGEMLATRAMEADGPGAGPPGMGFEELTTEFIRAAGAVVDAVLRLNDDLEEISAFFEDSDKWNQGTPEVENAATQLEGAATRLKRHGREIYDSVVDLDLVFEGVLRALGEDAEFDPDATPVLEAFAQLAATAEKGLDFANGFYEAVSQMEEVSSSLRAPVRNMRAGMRDMIDARLILIEWGRRAAALR